MKSAPTTRTILILPMKVTWGLQMHFKTTATWKSPPKTKLPVPQGNIFRKNPPSAPLKETPTVWEWTGSIPARISKPPTRRGNAPGSEKRWPVCSNRQVRPLHCRNSHPKRNFLSLCPTFFSKIPQSPLKGNPRCDPHVKPKSEHFHMKSAATNPKVLVGANEGYLGPPNACLNPPLPKL